jgi:hypothetical protein
LEFFGKEPIKSTKRFVILAVQFSTVDCFERKLQISRAFLYLSDGDTVYSLCSTGRRKQPNMVTLLSWNMADAHSFLMSRSFFSSSYITLSPKTPVKFDKSLPKSSFVGMI